jgi:hypothetical protein
VPRAAMLRQQMTSDKIRCQCYKTFLSLSLTKVVLNHFTNFPLANVRESTIYRALDGSVITLSVVILSVVAPPCHEGL